MTAVDQMGGRVCFGGNFDEIFMLHFRRDNNTWMVALLACVIHKACVCNHRNQIPNQKILSKEHVDLCNWLHSTILIVGSMFAYSGITKSFPSGYCQGTSKRGFSH